MNISLIKLNLIMKILLIHLYLLNINISLIQLYIIMNDCIENKTCIPGTLKGQYKCG